MPCLSRSFLLAGNVFLDSPHQFPVQGTGVLACELLHGLRDFRRHTQGDFAVFMLLVHDLIIPSLYGHGQGGGLPWPVKATQLSSPF